MPIDWRGEARPDTVADLVARKKYGRAIELVRQRLEAQPRNLGLRVQLANILVQAGRGPEAVPIFMALADDFAADGFLARAIAALKQVEKIEPGRNDVESRLQTLTRERAEGSGASPRAPAPPRSPAVPAPGGGVVPPPDGSATPEGPHREKRAAPEGPEHSSPRSGGRVTSRLRGVFRRLFGSEGDAGDMAPRAEAPAEGTTPEGAVGAISEAPAAAPVEAPGDGSTPGGALGAISETPAKAPAGDTTPEGAVGAMSEAPLREAVPEPPPVSFTDTVVPVRSGFPDEDTNPEIQPEPPPARRARREPSPGEEFLSMPEDALLDQFDDLLEDIFQPPTGGPVVPATAVAARAPSPDTSLPTQGGLTGLMFDELDPDERLAVLRGLKLRTFEPGDILVTEGEPPSGLYLLTAGGVKVHARDAESRNHPKGSLDEGDFFGEIASRSGLPRNATVVATAPGELLELEQASLDRIAQSHPRVWERMNAFARERAASRKPAEEEPTGPPATEAPFDPKLRLRLASAFLRAGQRDQALPILLDLADDLVRRGEGDKAVALLKKVELVQSGEAPRATADKPARQQGSARPRPITDDRLGQWLQGMAARNPSRPRPAPPGPRVWADRLAEPETLRAYAGLRDCRLFDDLSEEALLTLLQRLPLESFEPGDIVLTEGEPGDSVLVVGVGRVKVFVRQQSGRDVLVREAGEGAFLGDAGVLTGRPRTETATASAPSLLLRVGRTPLEAVCRANPLARKVLEDAVGARSTHLDETKLPDEPRGD